MNKTDQKQPQPWRGSDAKLGGRKLKKMCWNKQHIHIIKNYSSRQLKMQLPYLHILFKFFNAIIKKVNYISRQEWRHIFKTIILLFKTYWHTAVENEVAVCIYAFPFFFIQYEVTIFRRQYMRLTMQFFAPARSNYYGI